MYRMNLQKLFLVVDVLNIRPAYDNSVSLLGRPAKSSADLGFTAIPPIFFCLLLFSSATLRAR